MKVIDLEPDLRSPAAIQAALVHQDGELKVLRMSVRKGAALLRHRSNVPLSILVLSGRGRLRTARKSFALGPGVFCSLEADRVHDVRADADLVLAVTKYG